MTVERDLEIRQGKTFVVVIRWQTSPIVYRPITGISQVAPVLVTAPLHGAPDGWPVAVTSVRGMHQINATANEIEDEDYRPCTFVDANTLEINSINASEFSAYESGGYLQYKTPVDLSGRLARFIVKNKVGGTVLLSLTEMDGVVYDNATKTITITVDAADTASFSWKSGVYELESEDSAGVVDCVAFGAISVIREVAV